MIYTWRTKKESDGTFTALVLEIGFEHGKTLKKVPGFASRAQAKGHAIKWVRHFKAAAA